MGDVGDGSGHHWSTGCAPVPVLLLPGEEAVTPLLGSLSKCPAQCLGWCLLPLQAPSLFFFFRGIESGAVPLAGGKIFTDTLPLYGGPVLGSFKGPEQVAPWTFGTGCPCLLLCCLFAFLYVLLQP